MSGLLDVGDGHRVFWESHGVGKPAVVLHGGPGSGCTPWHRELFDLESYRVVLPDQRNCGRSRPHASEPDVDLAANTTAALVADLERLREHLEIERWLVVGGSWGSTLALAYAHAHPTRVTAMVLFGVTTGRREEFDWLFRGGLARFLPEQWERLRAAFPEGEVVDACHHRLFAPDPETRRAAAEDWCRWESATVDWPPRDELAERFRDPAYALAFARIVTHYVRHDAWLEDGVLLRDPGVRGILIHGRFDLQAPLGNAYALARAWPAAEVRVVDGAGHAAGALTAEIRRATDDLVSA